MNNELMGKGHVGDFVGGIQADSEMDALRMIGAIVDQSQEHFPEGKRVSAHTAEKATGYLASKCRRNPISGVDAGDDWD